MVHGTRRPANTNLPGRSQEIASPRCGRTCSSAPTANAPLANRMSCLLDMIRGPLGACVRALVRASCCWCVAVGMLEIGSDVRSSGWRRRRRKTGPWCTHCTPAACLQPSLNTICQVKRRPNAGGGRCCCCQWHHVHGISESAISRRERESRSRGETTRGGEPTLGNRRRGQNT